MFSDNIKDYILNNINERDFFDNKFLNLFRLELYKDEPDILEINILILGMTINKYIYLVK